MIAGTAVLAEGASQQVAPCAGQCLLNTMNRQPATPTSPKNASCLTVPVHCPCYDNIAVLQSRMLEKSEYYRSSTFCFSVRLWPLGSGAADQPLTRTFYCFVGCCVSSDFESYDNLALRQDYLSHHLRFICLCRGAPAGDGAESEWKE